MTTTLMQQNESGAAWNFDSVFAALEKAPFTGSSISSTTPVSKNSSASIQGPFVPQSDDDETPKATPAPASSTTLGDFGPIIAYLGFKVSVTAPVESHEKVNISRDSGDKVVEVTTPENAQKNLPGFDSQSDMQALEARKVDAKRAEKSRRAVLDSYLGSSPELASSGELKQKLLKSKAASQWVKTGLSPSSVLPTAVTQSRKQASTNDIAEKKIRLILELHKKFPENLSSFINISSHNTDLVDDGIHVFVDISNILIGFHDTLKRNRQINRNLRVPRQTLSFHNLSIILERGRAVAKRFLAGSDDIDCTQEARLLGYTTHILQRVEKPDPIISPGIRRGKRSGFTSSDTDSPSSGRIKRAEQAVDEVLHLGMLQSLLDTDKPSTIVLASGDAAKAEFSDGFLKQVERALLKGWNVEVIAFQATTGFAYRDPKWISKWSNSFRLIQLDYFAELLHIPHVGSHF